MNIGIIGGTGALGAALAGRLSQAGHDVWIGSRDRVKAEAFARDMLGEASDRRISGGGLADVARQSELVFVTVPYSAHRETLVQIREAVQGKIVVDATVPLQPPKVGTVQLPAAGCAAVEAAEALGPGVRVVSALQNIGAEKLGTRGVIDADVFVAGDDAEAVETVRAILAQLDLRSWHVGPLANSAAAEALTSVLIQLNRRYKLVQAGVRVTGKAKDAPQAAAGLSVVPVPGLPLFAAGADLAQAIMSGASAAGIILQDGDVVVVAQKVVSKVEGRTRCLSGVLPGPEAVEAAAKTGKDPAVVELIRSESKELMRLAPGIVVARHRTGHVLANAGIDASNVAPEADGAVLLWPEDPDASARALRAQLQARLGLRLAVIVSDSLGRAWRMGTTGSAIGVAGLKPLRDRRGETDLFGRVLQSTVVGVADEIAAAASLVIGEGAEGSPVAIVRGARYVADDEASIGELLRPLEEDLFR